MKEETYGALKRIIEEVKEKRKSECPMKDCVVNQIIGGNDIDLVENWINENEREFFEIPIYWSFNGEGKKRILDLDCMQDEFDMEIEKLINSGEYLEYAQDNNKK